MTTLAELRDSCVGWHGKSPEYVAKQIHRLPPMMLVVRETFILERCVGKRVLDVGASGPMHEAIKQVAKRCYGIDRPPVGWSAVLPHQNGDEYGINLDDYHAELPALDVDLIVCGEVIEHLSNPGWFLDRLKRTYPGVPVIITVPNAFTENGRRAMAEGVENVNSDHVAWYSPKTLSVLLSRAGYTIERLAWYNGKPPFAEGIVAEVR